MVINFLVEQLKSIISQTQNNLKIFIFNDKSTQKILNLEKAYLQNTNRKITLVNRKENHGFAKNFLLGLEDVGTNFDYYAFSDQDDIWENNKIEDAVKEISKFDFFKTSFILFQNSIHLK